MTHSSSRRRFVETSVMAAAGLAGMPRFSHILAARRGEASTPATKPGFTVTDYHVHLSPTLTIEQAIQFGKERQVQIGIGLQPVYAGWSKSFSKSLLDELDYVLMDALTLPNSDGTWLAIWQIDTHVDDEEVFMTRYMQFIEQVLTTEPIDIFAWPTFLPVPIARQYSQLWTRPRMQHIIDLAQARKIAIEINEVAHVPDENFITLAKRAGLKFTFGTDSRNQKAAHFYYCYQMAQKCGLTESDMFVPKGK